MSFIRSSKPVQSIAFLSLRERDQQLQEGQELFTHWDIISPVPASIAMPGCQINSSVFIAECWFSKYVNGKLFLQKKKSPGFSLKASGDKCLNQETGTHMVT